MHGVRCTESTNTSVGYGIDGDSNGFDLKNNIREIKIASDKWLMHEVRPVMQSRLFCEESESGGSDNSGRRR